MKLGVRLLLALACGSRVASATEPRDPGSDGPSLLDRLASGKDLLQSAPAIAEFDGAWSIVMQLETLLTSRRWDAPYPNGLLAQEVTRVLYGTSWTTMIALEALLASLASDGSFAWLAEARYRTDWMFGVTAPACAGGAKAGCGAGSGTYGGLHVRPRGSDLWFEVTGGWLEQRVASDARRTLAESSFVLSPLAVSYGMSERRGALGVDAKLGVGAYFGMHSAHVHPTEEGARTLDVPWHELYPIDVGAGPGARAELGVTLAHSVRLEGGVVLAPLLLGSRRPNVGRDLAPLVAAKRGIPCWRAANVGVALADGVLPMRLALSLFASELSTRPVGKLGYGGFMLRFDFPLRAE